MKESLLENYIVQHIRAFPGPIINFSWHGGEPTLSGIEYFRLIVSLQKKHRPPGKQITNGIQTNGTLLNKEWCRFLAAEHFTVGLSLDGPEEFHVVLLDVRGRLLRTVQVAEGSLTQCPVSPRDALRPAIREGAHGVIFVHNHPSGDPAPSPEDFDLTERLRAASELVGVLARDHVIVASGGWYSFVAAGRWRG